MNQKYDNLYWMKLSEISRYWAAKELTKITSSDNTILFKAPFACPGYTVRIKNAKGQPRIMDQNGEKALQEKQNVLQLEPGTWVREGDV